MNAKRIAIYATGLITGRSAKTNDLDLSAAVKEVLRLLTTPACLQESCLIVQVRALFEE